MSSGLRWLVGTKHFPESKNTSQNPKHVPESKNTSQNPKHFPESKNTSQNPKHFPEFKKHVPESETLHRIQKHVPESILDVVWILGSVFGFWDVFWILGSVFGFWEVFCPYEPPYWLLQISSHRDDRRIFWGLKFSISGFFGVGKFWQVFFVVA